MVRSVTTFDAEWTDEDMRAALAWQRDKAEQCSGCGHYSSESMDPDNASRWDAEPVACHVCAAKDRAVRAYRNAKGDEDGVRWRIKDREEGR